jgi:hypothetical protein
MTKKPQTSKDAAEKVVKNIRRKTRQTYSAEEKIRIVLACLRGEESISVPFLISVIPNIARTRPQLNRDKTNGGASAISLVACAVSPCCSTTPKDQLGDLFQNRLLSSRLRSISSY